MKVNSREALRTGSLLVQRFGSWSEVRKNSKPNRRGVLIVRSKDEDKADAKGQPGGQ